MGKNIDNINNPLTTVPDDALMYVGVPGGVNPDPFTDATTTALVLKAPLQTQIDDNETDIIDHETRIQDLEDGSTKVFLPAQSGAFTYPQPANSKLIGIYMRRNGVTAPRTAVGYTLYDGGGTNGEEILSSRLHTVDENYYREIESIPQSYNYTGSRTIYFQAISGAVDVVIYLKTNLFT